MGLLKKNRYFTYSDLATVIFLGSFFLRTIRVGSYEIPIPSQHLEVAVIFILIVLAFGHKKNKSRKVHNLYIVLLNIFPLIVIFLLYFLTFHIEPIAGTSTQYLISSLRFLIYLTVIIIYRQFFFEENNFLRIFTKFYFFIGIVGIIAYIFHILLGTQYLLDPSYGSYRVQAFFSEPSAWAPVLGSFTLIGFHYRDYKILFLTLLLLVLVKSPTAILVVSISMILFLIKNNITPKNIIRLLILIVVVVSIILFFLFGGYSWLESLPIIGNVFTRLNLGIQSLLTLNYEQLSYEQGYNPRLDGAIDVLENMRKNNLLLTGYGMNSNSVYFENIYGVQRAFSFFLSILFDFGLIGITILITISLLALYSLNKNKSPYIFIYIPFLIVSIINSAQGLITYKVFLIGIFPITSLIFEVTTYFKSDNPR